MKWRLRWETSGAVRGTVVHQVPSPRTEVTKGSTVILSVSLGPKALLRPTSPTLLVSPASDLRNGQMVIVSVSGFPPGKERISECASPLDVNLVGCGPQPAAQPFIVIENGTGTTTIAVTEQAPTGPPATMTAPCTPTCVLEATDGDGTTVMKPLTFLPSG